MTEAVNLSSLNISSNLSIIAAVRQLKLAQLDQPICHYKWQFSLTKTDSNWLDRTVAASFCLLAKQCTHLEPAVHSICHHQAITRPPQNRSSSFTRQAAKKRNDSVERIKILSITTQRREKHWVNWRIRWSLTPSALPLSTNIPLLPHAQISLLNNDTWYSISMPSCSHSRRLYCYKLNLLPLIVFKSLWYTENEIKTQQTNKSKATQAILMQHFSSLGRVFNMKSLYWL